MLVDVILQKASVDLCEVEHHTYLRWNFKLGLAGVELINKTQRLEACLQHFECKA